MAITRFIQQKNTEEYRSGSKLRRAIEYITSRKKTSPGLIGGLGVEEKNALLRMKTVKELFYKEGGREYVHFVVSPEGKKDPDALYFAANEIAGFYFGFQVLYAVHLNTDNTHVHFILNTVNVFDGHKFSQSRADLERFKDVVESVLYRYGIYADIEENTFYDMEEDEFDTLFSDEDASSEESIAPLQFINENKGSEYEKIELVEPMIFYAGKEEMEKDQPLVAPMIFYTYRKRSNHGKQTSEP